ncbi:MAG TPA: ABC transporter permease [Bacillota bacterium]|nr:ABC transporter permease [Bacillota bacterium]
MHKDSRQIEVGTSGRSPAANALRRFASNPLGMAGACIVLVLILTALFAQRLAPYNPLVQNYHQLLKPPGPGHLLGTDDLGRDELSRMLYGTRISLGASVLSVSLAIVIGVPVGLLSGYYRGWLDDIIVMRLTDALLAFPFLILALAMAAFLGPSFTHETIAIGVGFIPGFIRLARGQAMSEREREYVSSARAVGSNNGRILLRHILPNAMAPLLIQATLAMSFALLADAGLSYLGLGVPPPAPSWGTMLNTAQGYLTQAPWLSYWPGLGIFFAVLGFNLMGDGIRDALDVRLRQ